MVSRSVLPLRVLLLLLLAAASVSAAPPFQIDFDNLGDLTSVTTQYSGVVFSHATAVRAGVSLNEFEAPPHSGLNVIYDDGGSMSLTFPTPVTSFGGYFTYTNRITLTAFNANNVQVATATSAFNNNCAQTGDNGSSPNEFLSLNYGGPIARITVVGTAGGASFTLDDVAVGATVSPAASIQFTSSEFNVDEGAGFATVSLSRSGDTTSTISVDFETIDNTARQRTDYTLAAGSVTFASGETSKTFRVLIVDDGYAEGSETLTLMLSNATGGAGIGSPGTAVLTILDNDLVATSTNPIDQTRLFVQQHYYDFLSRYPDTSGWDFWIGTITPCGLDPFCIQNKRVDASNAFFYELEFQQTGSYVYRMYRAAFGNNQPFPNPNPDPAHPGEEKKVPLYLPFMKDRARVRGGAQLAQLQLELANAFIQRDEFKAKYPLTLDGPSFVDAVSATIQNDLGVNLVSQRQALIGLFNSGGRGNVLYRLVDDNAQGNPINNRTLIDSEYNRAFVYTQYAGYLRRNPDMAGFLFWLGQVNGAALRDVPRQHAMVCSFITSDEYQQRFSAIVSHHNSECPH